MAVENPLDKAADLAKNAGDMASGLLGGTARFLEQVTGDTFTAAVFAAMLIFTLTLVKGAAGARNPRIYIKTIVFIGAAIIIGVAAISAYNAFDQFPLEFIRYKESLYTHKGFGVPFSESEPTKSALAIETFQKLKWYCLIGVAMTSAGIIMSFVTRSNKSTNTSAV